MAAPAGYMPYVEQPEGFEPRAGGSLSDWIKTDETGAKYIPQAWDKGNFKSSFMEDWAPLLMFGGPIAAMGGFGALGGLAGGAEAGAGAGGAMDMGLGTQGWMDYLGSQVGAGPLAGGVTDMPWGVNPQTGGGVDYTDFANDIVDSSGNLLNSQPNWDLFTGSASTPSWLSNLPNSAGSFLKSILGSGGGLSGAALGALLGGLGANQKPAGNITTTQDIPDYLKPYQSMNLTSGMANFGLASQGAGLLPGAQGYMQDQIAGKYLDPNLNPAFQPYVKDLMGQAGSQFAARYGATPEALGNSGNQEGFTRAITAAALPLYNSAFQTAQGNQFNAATNAPAFANNVAGAALAPNLAFKNLYTGPQTNTTPYFTNPMAGALSGSLAGGMLGSQLGR